MLKRKILHILITAAFIAGLLFSCTTKKNTPITRGYHNLTAYYNALYNAKDAFKSGQKHLMDKPGDNYAQMLNIFYYSNDKAAQLVSGDMNRLKEKASKVIKRHSITVKPKKRSKNKPEFNDLPEYCKHVDNAFLIKGKAELYSAEYYPALETFNYIIQEYSMMETKYDGQLWLARTYLEMNKFDKAKEFLDLMEGDNKFPKRLNRDYLLTFADYHKKQYEFEQAAEYLKKAIPLTKNKAHKYRYHFILAQIYQELEMNDEANENYAIVMKKNPIYEMVFNARINMAMLYRSTQGSPEELQRELMKMLKDDKNKEFQDQIYFALGSIEENKGNISKAIELYSKSAAVSVQNDYQKTESYLAVARIYFDRPDYENAQIYYDSAVTFIDNKRRDFAEIYKKSTNLNELVKHIKTINHQDSLQRIAAMPDAKRIALIDEIIKELIEEEKRIQEEEQMKRLALQNQRSNNQNRDNGGGWYFYNPTTVSMGESAFKQKWGNRKLEDHWRRSDKAEIMTNDPGGGDTPVDSTRITDNKKREFYLQDLPISDSALHISDSLIQNAYYELANVYRIKMENLEESADTYKELMKRFPDFDKKLHVYYNLHKIYEDLNDQINSKKYRDLVISLYPNSLYAQLMTNPEYIKKLQRQEQQAKFFYATTYRLFKSGKYQQVINNFHRADTAYADHELHSKFALLNTISRGRLSDSATFVAYLKEYIEAYPQAEETAYATDLLRYMSSEQELPQGVEAKKEENIAENAKEEIQVDYYWEEKVPHYYISVVDTRKTSANQVKFNISNFNIDYYSILTFNVKDFVFSANYQMISVDPFTAWYNAMNYYESIEYIKEVYEGIPKQDYVHFVISEKNYKILFETKAISQYLKFFENNYLKRRTDND
jgi:tetratricopeptide (TPR) repeat protein